MKKAPTNTLLASLIFFSLVSKAQNDTCAILQKKVDDFTGEISIWTPLTFETAAHSSPGRSIFYSTSATKSITKGKSYYYLSLRVNGLTLAYNKKGAYVLFQDGTKWIKSNEEIDVEASEDGFEYHAFITVTSEDIRLFSKKPIKKFKLYIYEKEVEEREAEDFATFCKCLLKAK